MAIRKGWGESGFWEEPTICECVGVVLRFHHLGCVDARGEILRARGSPVDGDGVALEEISEEKGDGPDEDDDDIDPYGNIDGCALKNAVLTFSIGSSRMATNLPFVEHQDREFSKAKCQRLS